jgi:hypothetical protein
MATSWPGLPHCPVIDLQRQNALHKVTGMADNMQPIPNTDRIAECQHRHMQVEVLV